MKFGEEYEKRMDPGYQWEKCKPFVDGYYEVIIPNSNAIHYAEFKNGMWDMLADKILWRPLNEANALAHRIFQSSLS